MTIAPTTLSDLAAYWKAHGGVNLGIVGDAAHQTRPTYHNGQDVIKANGWTAATDYSIRLPRDREPYLTNAAAAIDLGELNGSLTELRKFSEWLVEQALVGTCPDIREIIYCTADGQFIERWSGPDNKVYTSLKKTSTGWVTVTPQNGDASHAMHTHISYYRDSESRDKTAVFRPYFEDDLPGLQFQFVDRISGIATVSGADHAIIRVDNAAFVAIPAGQQREVAGRVVLTQPVPGHESIGAGTAAYLIGNIPGATPDVSQAAILLVKDATFTAQDCAEQVTTATAPLKAQNATLTSQVTSYEGRLRKINDLSAI